MSSGSREGFLDGASSGRYQARFTGLDGGAVAAPHTFATKADASAYLAEVEADLRRGAYLDHRRGNITFAAWAELYSVSIRKGATTSARDRVVLRKHLLPALSSTPLSAITPMRVQQLVNALAERLAPKTVKTNYGVLRAILNAAVNDDRIVRSPCRAIALPRETHKPRRTLTAAEVRRLAAAMPIAYRLMIPLAGILGLRWSEVIALRVSSLELLSRPAFVFIADAMPTADGEPILGPTKTASGTRKVPLPDPVAAEASAHLTRLGVTAADSDTFLFQAPRGGPLRATNFRSRIWRPALRAAHLVGLTFQDLRRTAMTLWGESGVPPRAIQLLAGHSDPRLSQAIYQQVTESLHLDTAERLGNLWKLTDGSADNQQTG